MKKFCCSTYVAYMVVDYWLSCKELTALQSCRKKKTLQNPDKTPGGLLVKCIDSWWTPPGVQINSWDCMRSPYTLSGVHQEFIRSIRTPDGVHLDSWGSVSYRLKPLLTTPDQFFEIPVFYMIIQHFLMMGPCHGLCYSQYFVQNRP